MTPILRMTIPALCILIFIAVGGTNAATAIRYLRNRTPGSMIPFVGGLVGSLGFVASPWRSLAQWWWVPLILDLGTVPLICQFAVFLIRGGPSNAGDTKSAP